MLDLSQNTKPSNARTDISELSWTHDMSSSLLELDSLLFED